MGLVGNMGFHVGVLDSRCGVCPSWKDRSQPAVEGLIEKEFWGCFDPMASLN